MVAHTHTQQMYDPGVSLAIVCGVLLGTAKQRQGLALTVPAFVVVGPNSEADTLSTVICSAIGGSIWDDSFSVKKVREKYVIMDELRPKIT